MAGAQWPQWDIGDVVYEDPTDTFKRGYVSVLA